MEETSSEIKNKKTWQNIKFLYLSIIFVIVAIPAYFVLQEKNLLNSSIGLIYIIPAFLAGAMLDGWILGFFDKWKLLQIFLMLISVIPLFYWLVFILLLTTDGTM